MRNNMKSISFIGNEFKEGILQTRKELFYEGHFSDVTLVSDDFKTFNVHRSVLFSASNVFKNLLLLKPHNSETLLFLRGIKCKFLESILEFIYFGEVSIPEKQVKEFIKCGKILQIESFDGEIPLSKFNNVPDAEKDACNETFRGNEEDVSENKEEEEKEMKTENRQYSCEKCEFKSKDASNLKIHVNRLHNKGTISSVIAKYACDKCSYTNVNPDKMKQHKKTKHSSSDPESQIMLN